MDQEIIDTAVKIATKRALEGDPVARIVWMPPRVASDDWRGSFVVYNCPPLTAADTPPWEKR